MRKRKILIALMVLLCCFWTGSCAQEFDYSMLSAYELNQLGSDITQAKETYHTKVTYEEEETVLDAVKAATEAHFAAQGIDISWAWVNYTYAKEWNLLKVSTHIDYRDANNQKHKDNVYGEVYPLNGKSQVVYLSIADSPVIDKRILLPSSLGSDVDADAHIINKRTGIDLTVLSLEELNTLSKTVRSEIKTNHEASDSEHDAVKSTVKAYVEDYYASQGITSVEWPWFDYTCSRDWGRFTEKTRLSYKNASGDKCSLSVYAEVYNDAGSNEVFYLTLGDQVIVDRRDELTSEYCTRYQRSQAYDQAMALLNNEQYEEAKMAFTALGSFSNSASMVEQCQEGILQGQYDEANRKYNNKQYAEARELYLQLGNFLDSEEKAKLCTAAIQENLYNQAKELHESGNHQQALSIYEEIADYEDSAALAAVCQEEINTEIYAEAVAAIDEEQYELALETLAQIPEFMDAQALMTQCTEKMKERDYAKAVQLFECGHYDDACMIFEALGEYADSTELAAKCKNAQETVDRNIVVSEMNLVLYKEKRIQLEPVVESTKPTAPETTKILYRSTNEKILKVFPNGMISAVGEGTASVLCYAEDNPNVITEVTVQVVLPVNQIRLDQSNLTILYNQEDPSSAKYTFMPTILPANAHDQTILWTSSNEDIVKVNDQGEVTAVAPGRATITATAQDQTNGIRKATCTVTVELAVSSITLSMESEAVFVGKSETMQATISPENAKNKKVTWSSSDTSIATVGSNGAVKGIASGTAVITATASNGVSSQYEVTVKQGPATFTISAKATLIARNHVGSRWTKEFCLDGEDFSGSKTFTAEKDQFIRFSCDITENDSRPDCGRYFERIQMTDDVFQNGYTIEETIYVQENSGRYAGNVAEWKLKVTIKKR